MKRLLRRRDDSRDADNDMQGGSSLMVNELEFKKMRQKKKNGRTAPQFGNSHLNQDNENMLSLVGEIDE